MDDRSDDEDSEVHAKHRSSSRIFARNRSLGYVSNHIPATTRYFQRRRENMITTCIGRYFQIFSASHFRLLHVGNTHPDEITAMANDSKFVYTASAKCIYAWRAGKHVFHLYHGHTNDIWLLLPFGDHLIALDTGNVLKVWDVEDEVVYLDLPFQKEEFHITAMAHPPTYVNKVILGSEQGHLQLWNLHENRLVYSFVGHASRVTCIEPAPALDVVGIGHADGTIKLLNLKYDETLMSFCQDWGSVTQLAFRTDGPPILVSGSEDGHVAFWNLEEKKACDQLKAHLAAVTTVVCLPNEPLLLTTSPDNSMKLWIFDGLAGSARQLRIRDGHTGPPLCIRYYGIDGKFILSSGNDSTMRAMSTISESLHKSLGRATYNPKATKSKNRMQPDAHLMPPIKEFTSETTREMDWDNIAAIHDGILQTTTWSFSRSCMGKHRLIPEQFQNKTRKDFNTETTCITLTHCGNFVVMGYSNGSIERFNIQSGIHRASYGAPTHNAAVRGLVTDVLNQYVVSGCSDGHLCFWPFKGANEEAQHQINFDYGIELMRMHRESALIAVALMNFVLHIIDFDTRILVRIFEGHTARINDIAFMPDSRWLISAAMDATIKVWDIPSAYMIDHFRAERPCVSLTVSPNGDFLATAHVNYLGIHLWANKALFGGVTLRSMDPHSSAPYIDLPIQTISEMELQDDNDADEMARSLAKMGMIQTPSNDNDDDDDDGEEINTKYSSPAQLDPNLVSLSTLPPSRWQNLLDMDAIRKRNKPKAPLRVPKKAPFFLPTIAGIDMKFDLTNGNAKKEDDATTGSKFKQLTNISNLTAFGRLLDSANCRQDYEKCFQHLKELGPSMIDFEIKSLHPLSGGTCQVMIKFLETIQQILDTKADFELAQMYLASFIRSHGLNLCDYPEITSTLNSVAKVQEKSWQELEKQFMYALGVVGALRNFAR